MFIGLLLVVHGLLILLDRLGYIQGDIWGYFWPLALVALGLSMVVTHRRKEKR